MEEKTRSIPWPRVDQSVDVAVLDTSAVIGENWLQSDASQRILSAKNPLIHILLPDVVADELRKKFAQELNKLIKDLDHYEKSCRRITKAPIPLSSARRALERLPQEPEFLSRVDRAARGETQISSIRYPDVSHPFVVGQILSKNAPCSHGDKDYRDLLIWHSAATAIRAERDIRSFSIVSRDKKAFSLEGVLHPDLRQLLSSSTHESPELHWFNNMHEFEQAILARRVAELGNLEDRIEWIARSLKDPAGHRFSIYYEHHGLVPWSFQGSESIQEVARLDKILIFGVYAWEGRSWATGLALGTFVVSCGYDLADPVELRSGRILSSEPNTEWPSITDYVVETEGAIEFEVVSHDEFESIDSIAIHDTYPPNQTAYLAKREAAAVRCYSLH